MQTRTPWSRTIKEPEERGYRTGSRESTSSGANLEPDDLTVFTLEQIRVYK